MKTIYLVEFRENNGEWTAMAAYVTYDLAKKAIERNISQDRGIGLYKFYYRINEIALFNF